MTAFSDIWTSSRLRARAPVPELGPDPDGEGEEMPELLDGEGELPEMQEGNGMRDVFDAEGLPDEGDADSMSEGPAPQG